MNSLTIVRIALFTLTARCSYSLLTFLAPKRKLLTSSLSSVSELRKEYSKKGLNEEDSIVQAGPFSLFNHWITEAINAKVVEPNAMCLATCEDNKPSARFVLLKGYDERGFVWFTNYNSRKGSQLAANPNAAISFWWGELERSVRIEGTVTKVSDAESEAYFTSRPRGSQIGAWSSNQSQPVLTRSQLQDQEQEALKQFGETGLVPRPAHWGGYRLNPTRIEFWKGRESRLHDRIVFEKIGNEWKLVRLQP